MALIKTGGLHKIITVSAYLPDTQQMRIFSTRPIGYYSILELEVFRMLPSIRHHWHAFTNYAPVLDTY